MDNDILKQFMDYYANMQKQIMDAMKKLKGYGFDDEINSMVEEMAQIERKIKEKSINKEFLNKKQEKLRKKFRKLMIKLSDKTKKKEYKSESNEKKFKKLNGKTIIKKEKRDIDFKLPKNFPVIDETLKRLIKTYFEVLDEN
jgi:t-SNARE complex subunit (syntaxin)